MLELSQKRSYWLTMHRTGNLKSKVLQLVVPRNYIGSVLEEAHDSPSGGHFDINKTLHKIHRGFTGLLVKKTLNLGIDPVRDVLRKRVLQIKSDKNL